MYEIKECNILIATFLGYRISDDGLMIKDDSGFWTEMRYEQSWDWLMDAVEEIMDMCFDCDEETGEELNDPEDFYAIRDCIPDITQTYKAVIEFIKNYNKKKLNKNGSNNV